MADPKAPKPAHPATIAVNQAMQALLPFDDVQDFADARRGFITTVPDGRIENKRGNTVWNLGAYLVEGPGHCAECHTPRNWLLAMDTSRWLQGGPHPEGDGQVPSLRSLKARNRFKDANDLATGLEFGETLGYDKMSSGGMAAVQTNMSKLPAEDRLAISTYLMSLE